MLSRQRSRSEKTIDAVKMIESMIKDSEIYPTEDQLWQNLHGKIPHRLFKEILLQFELDNKIIYHKDNSIIWIFADNPPIIKTLKESIPLR